jgi:hypothetical protein
MVAFTCKHILNSLIIELERVLSNRIKKLTKIVPNSLGIGLLLKSH